LRKTFQNLFSSNLAIMIVYYLQCAYSVLGGLLISL